MKRTIAITLSFIMIFLSSCGSKNEETGLSSKIKSEKEKVSSPFNSNLSEKNYEINLKVEQSREWYDWIYNEPYGQGKTAGIIYWQNNSILSGMKYGTETVSKSGCGVIAFYNALHLMGRYTMLSDLIYDFEKSGKLVMNGVFGTEPSVIEVMSSKYDFEYEYTDEIHIADTWGPSGGVVIFTFWNEKGDITKGVHTVAAQINYDKIHVYNLFTNREEIQYFADFRSLLEHVNGDFICAYYIKNM